MLTVDAALDNAERLLGFAQDEADLVKMSELRALAEVWVAYANALIQATAER